MPPVASMTAAALIRSGLPSGVQQMNAGDAAILDPEVGGKAELAKRNVLDGSGAMVEGAADFPARGVTVSVQHAIAAVRTLASEGKPGALLIEVRAPLDEFLDAQRAFLDEDARRIAMAEAIAGDQRVLQMQADLVLVAEGDGDAALGVLGVRFAQFEFGQTEHTPIGGQLDCRPHAGDAGAHDNEIGLPHDPVCRQIYHRRSAQSSKLRAFDGLR